MGEEEIEAVEQAIDASTAAAEDAMDSSVSSRTVRSGHYKKQFNGYGMFLVVCAFLFYIYYSCVKKTQVQAAKKTTPIAYKDEAKEETVPLGNSLE